MAELRQAISQHTTVASSSPDSPSLVVDWSPTSEPLQELPAPIDGRDYTDGEQVSPNANATPGESPSKSPTPIDDRDYTDGEEVSPNANATPGESPSKSPAPIDDRDYTDGEQVGPNANASPGKPQSESLLTPSGGELALVSIQIGETPLKSELPSESSVTLPDGDYNLVSLPESKTGAFSDQPSESFATPADGESITEPPEMENALVASEVLSESLTTTSDFLETLNQPLVKEKESGHLAKEMPAQIPKSLTGAALARRLGVSTGSISRNKTKDNFGQWTFQHDPDGISWHFDSQTFRSVVSSPPP